MRELGHFLLGYTLTRILSDSYLSKDESKAKYKHIIPILGGIWAMIPDALTRIGTPETPASKWYDLFFFHRLLDKLDAKDEPKNQYPIILAAVTTELVLIKK